MELTLDRARGAPYTAVMRTPRARRAPFALALLLAALSPAAAQVKVDLGAPAATGAGVSAAAGASALSAPAPLAAPALGSSLTPSLSGAPSASLAPSARPEAAGLPASALVAAPAASVPAEAPKEAPKAAAAAAAAPPAPPGTPSAAAAPAPPGGPPSYFVQALQNLGVSQELTTRLTDFLAKRHPGNQDAIYHGLGHSREVADLTARVVENASLPPSRKILLIFAASLHDVDPQRVPDTPARVAATIQHLSEDPDASALVAEFSSRHGFTPDQVQALILATDFSPDPVDMKARQDRFVAAAEKAFPGEDFGLVWGRRLAFVDQSSTYLGDVEGAKKRVEGLAHEIRAQLESIGKGPGPTDEMILAGTGKFLSVLRQNPNFAILPPDLQKKFEAVDAYFAAKQTPEAWTAAAAPAPARAPPDAAAARNYVRSIAAGIKLNERQTDALIQQFFEENGIDPASPRADAVRRELVPGKFTTEEKTLAGLSPFLQRHRGVLLRLAAERKTTPTAIEALLARRGVLEVFSHLSDSAFELQAGKTLDRDELERAVAAYPDTAQGRFMRELAGHMATASGKSVEEVARDGVFAYVDFAGNSVLRATSGRDPDVRSVQMVFYVTRRGGRWRVDGYRQNRGSASDAALVSGLKKWLAKGGVPAKDFE